MKLIKPYYEIITPFSYKEYSIKDVYRDIELAGRTCYKSEDKITEDSAESFVNRMVKSGHGAMLEHGTIYLKTDTTKYTYLNHKDCPYSIVNINYDEPVTWSSESNYAVYITTNYRVLVENNWINHLSELCEPTEFHEKRISVRFICDRGVSHEFVRHRVFSFAQESTRYCNYSKDKFGNELSFIIPTWLNYDEQSFTSLTDESCLIRTDLSENEWYIDSLLEAEKTYNWLINHAKWTPQQARSVLPNSLKTELVMTGTITQWEGFFKLRNDKAAHPSAQELAKPLHEEFKKRNYI